MTAESKKYLSTSEVEQLLRIPRSTLRYWEREFRQLRPQRNTYGYRQYAAKDIEVLRHIQNLLQVKGYSLTYAKQLLNSSSRTYAPRNVLQCHSPEVALALLEQAKARITDAHAVARIEAVARFIESAFFPHNSP